ncbi:MULTISPECIES: PucR family transcriptional regulator [unclassified Leucobacter]|uniref:PucR family transcriptional regulator n=1 Tax=unclassified Leucobacter TaxID=2621730 RepID=UPI001F145792|nr:PucR family transcriptional regulator [Leucobacter sp. CX169]
MARSDLASAAAAPPAAIPHATIPLGALLRQFPLGLVLIAGHAEDTAERPVQWVHSSDLSDPTPFLTPRTVLLTTGAQFAQEPSATSAAEYVEQLIDAGVCALGFAAEVRWVRTPGTIVAACEALGLPLFRVPYQTPFLAIIQTAARLLDAETHARDTWSLEAQRAIAGAALHADGISAVVRELAARLGRWVAITDRTGRVAQVSPKTARSEAGAEWIRRESATLVDRGVRSGRVLADGDAGAQLQTLGRGGKLRGVLVVGGSAALDHAEQTAVSLVAALATLSLEYRSGIATADTELRAAVLRLLVEEQRPLAERVAEHSLPSLPSDPVRVLVLDPNEPDGSPVIEDLRSLTASRPGALLARFDGAPTLVIEQRLLRPVTEHLAARGVSAGVSGRASVDALAEAIAQARLAYDIADASGQGPVEFRTSMASSVLGLLDRQPEAATRAKALLAPIRTHDARHSDRIAESLEIWLRHHGQTSPAATELGVHRHTLRTRVQTAAGLLQRDLDDPDVRAELWTALRLVG